jgi:ABC-2 type transport system permease protein
MWTELRYAFARHGGSILGWGLSIAALGLFLVPFYRTFLAQEQELLQLMNSYPPELMAFFGNVAAVTTPAGFMDTYTSYLPVILGIFTVMAGSGLVVADEEAGRLDLILAHPISRTGLFWGRLIALALATAALMALGYLGFALPLESSGLNLTWGQLALPFLAMTALILCFGAIALLLSMVLPSRRMAGSVAGLIMVASYFFTSLARIDDSLKPIARLLPYDYYQGGAAVDGLNLSWFFGVLLASLLMVLAAWWLFTRRDIRVGGEGSLHLGSMRAWRRRANTHVDM